MKRLLHSLTGIVSPKSILLAAVFTTGVLAGMSVQIEDAVSLLELILKTELRAENVLLENSLFQLQTCRPIEICDNARISNENQKR